MHNITRMNTRFLALCGCLVLTGLLQTCQNKAKLSQRAVVNDPHSFSQPWLARTTHLDLNLKVDFAQKRLTGTAQWHIERTGQASEIIFDTDHLDIQSVSLGPDHRPAHWYLAQRDTLLGAALHVALEHDAKTVTIAYSTRPDAAALGWMEPAMTAGKQQPFLFTQGQAILTRTWIPCQDTPGNRITYTAQIETPPGMMAVMSAENPQQKNPDGHYTFRMEQPIAPYLIALAVGDIAFRAVGPRTGIYAEPTMLDRAAWEFTDMEKMLTAAELLYGPYRWGRYDLIVLPTGFPFGGMENPRLTFATPTVITGDRSLVALVAHELAHSWSGNLVTNATWNDFWLNEGFTVYFERRIMEALYGAAYAAMPARLEYAELEATLKELGQDHPDTRLKLNLQGRSPDLASGDIAYVKGAAFLEMLEKLSDRKRWDAFLKSWFETNAFQARSTEDFLAFLKQHYLQRYQLEANVDEWVYGAGLPANSPAPYSARLEKAAQAAAGIAQAWPDTAGWSSHEWVHFVRNLPDGTPTALLQKLDAAYGLSTSGNAEIRCAWYTRAIEQGYVNRILPQVEDFLTSIGRRRFLRPVYGALIRSGYTAEAKRIFDKAKAGYHAVSRTAIEAMLQQAAAD